MSPTVSILQRFPQKAMQNRHCGGHKVFCEITHTCKLSLPTSTSKARASGKLAMGRPCQYQPGARTDQELCFKGDPQGLSKKCCIPRGVHGVHTGCARRAHSKALVFMVFYEHHSIWCARRAHALDAETPLPVTN